MISVYCDNSEFPEERYGHNLDFDAPIIKPIIINNNCYVYDTYTNYILGVSHDIFLEVCKLCEIGISKYIASGRTDEAYRNVILLLDKGFFKSTFVEKIEHPDTKYLSVMTDRCINQLILGITNLCNFSCRYCHQAEGKLLSTKSAMDCATAFKSIDFLFEHSKDAFEVTVTFYGGEPLLNFELIKSVVEYASEKFKTKNVTFNMTTNASLLSDDTVAFLVKNNFDLLISLDGNPQVQNHHRRYLSNGADTFDSVWKNIMRIKDKYPDYFSSNVNFNSVILNDENPDDINLFFENEGISKDKVSIRRADMSGIDYSFSQIAAHNLSDTDILYNRIYKDYHEHYSDKSIIPKTWHHNGPCIPSVRRLFVNADGDFFPCEKIDGDSSCKIGSLSDGINIGKVNELLNVGKLSENECKKCWAMRFCTMCVHDCIDDGKISKEKKLEHCKLQKETAVMFLKKYIEEQRSLK